MADVVATTSRYHYLPSKGIALTFIVLYSTSGALHLGEALYGRLWWMLPTVVLGLVGEIVGWACRYWSTFSGGLARTPYIAQFVCIILAPTFLLAGYFVLLGHVILVFGPEYSRVRHNRYVLFFCMSDLVALIIQGIGGGMAAASSTPNKAITGGHIALAGIAFQLFAIVVYVALVTEFILRFHFDRPVRPHATSSTPTPQIQDGWPFSSGYSTDTAESRQLKKKKLFALHPRLQLLLAGAGFSVIFILIRAIYRTAELSGGFNSPIADNQLTFDVLDGAMIMIANWLLNIFHPAFLLNRPKSAEMKVDWVHDHNTRGVLPQYTNNGEKTASASVEEGSSAEGKS